MKKSRRKALTHNNKVIKSTPEPTEWRFWDFTQNNNNAIEDWYKDLSEDAQNLFDSLLKNNHKVQNPINWIGFKRHLKGEFKGSGISKWCPIPSYRPIRTWKKRGDPANRLLP
jgi:hypothetical protein